jgi:hypothetical protein
MYTHTHIASKFISIGSTICQTYVANEKVNGSYRWWLTLSPYGFFINL